MLEQIKFTECFSTVFPSFQLDDGRELKVGSFSSSDWGKLTPTEAPLLRKEVKSWLVEHKPALERRYSEKLEYLLSPASSCPWWTEEESKVIDLENKVNCLEGEVSSLRSYLQTAEEKIKNRNRLIKRLRKIRVSIPEQKQ